MPALFMVESGTKTARIRRSREGFVFTGHRVERNEIRPQKHDFATGNLFTERNSIGRFCAARAAGIRKCAHFSGNSHQCSRDSIRFKARSGKNAGSATNTFHLFGNQKRLHTAVASVFFRGTNDQLILCFILSPLFCRLHANDNHPCTDLVRYRFKGLIKRARGLPQNRRYTGNQHWLVKGELPGIRIICNGNNTNDAGINVINGRHKVGILRDAHTVKSFFSHTIHHQLCLCSPE